MKKLLYAIASGVIVSTFAFGETISIKNPGYFPDGIRDGHKVFPDTLYFDSEAEEIVFPDMGTFVRLGDYNFPKLRKVTLGNMDYVPPRTFDNMPSLEEVVFDGMIGHIDCYIVGECPKLKKVVFNGPISSTGGPTSQCDCPELDSVIFNSLVVGFGLESDPEDNTPKLKNFTINGGLLDVDNDSLTPPISFQDIQKNENLIADVKKLANWQSEVLTAKRDNRWMRGSAYEDAKILYPIAEKLNLPEAAELKSAMEYAWNLGDDVKNNLEILKESPAYSHDSVPRQWFTYVLPQDSMLTETRSHFNLDSVAGQGDDISRIKNLLYWVHDNIRHDGGNGFPAGQRNLKNMYYSSRRDSCGYNCRALAIALTEALLSEGFPARYITCESKAWDTDNDCHVICVAWSESLNKWIWVDPTFAAFITDENGLLLHPGEVRYRLQNDLPLVLNEDANWNHQYQQTKERYLDNYMAKNLYILSANLLNQAEPEGLSDHIQGYAIGLIPEGSNYTSCRYLTTNDEWFWQPPTHFQPSSTPKTK